MKLTKPAVVASFVLLLAGCSYTDFGGKLYGWKSLNPPRENALGKEIFTSGDLGDPILSVVPENVERSSSIGMIKKETYDQASAGAELTVKKVTAELKGSYVKSEKLSSSDWVIGRLKNITEQIIVDRPFIYQCLYASSNSFTLESKTNANLNIDASKSTIAQTFGVDTAKVEIKTAPEKPDLLEIKISNPNVCFSYKAAKFIDDSDYLFWDISQKSAPIIAEGATYRTSFDLGHGEKSHFQTPKWVGKPPVQNPEYRLMATKNQQTGKPALSVCKQDKGTGGFSYTCKELEDDGFGKWDRAYHIDTFAYAQNKYKVVFLKISARISNEKISVKSAFLLYPEYILKIE